MSCGKCSATLAVLTLILAYYFYTPLPSNTVEPWKQIALRNIIRVISSVAKAGELVGYDSAVNITRAFLEAGNIKSDDKEMKVVDILFSGVPVRIYTPRNVKEKSPALVYIHGGGWALLSVDSYDPFVRRFSNESGIVMISVEYRRAPEHIFPVPFEDCLEAVKHFFDHAAKYGVDPDRIAISGDSAGGNLAMAVALNLSKDSNNVYTFKSQILIYPALQAFNFRLPSYQTFYDESGPFIISTHGVVRAFLWYGSGNIKLSDAFLTNNHTSAALKKSKYAKYINEEYLPGKYFSEKYKQPDNNCGDEKLSESISDWLLNPLFAPLMASDEDLSKLPPTYILLAEYDVLRDDGIILAKRLENLNKKVTLSYWEGLQHGFVVFQLDASNKAIDEMTQYVKENI